jgi:cytochrome c oxidase cbb3-type subunit 4
LTQIVYGAVLLAAFIGIVVWVFAKKRKSRFEQDADIPFDEKDR